LHPRAEWADRGPVGPLQNEEDVRFLLVHHTETPNGETGAKVPRRLRSIFDYHTGAKGWPDVAYNFFVDAEGGIWEGREGSIDHAVRGDATGGSQGHAVLCCFVGSHETVPPTPEAREAMAALLAWQASVHEIDLAAGPTITFTSRGSNRWPAGATVTTDPIAGHRDMSQTSCPGDAAYPLVRGALLSRARTLTGAAAAPATTAASTTTVVPTTTTPSTVTSAPPTTVSTTPPTTSAGDSAVAGDPSDAPSDPDRRPMFGAAAGGVVAAAVTGLVVRRRRAGRPRPAEPGGHANAAPPAGDLDEDDLWTT
jgi:hypothetical protein